MTIEPDAALLWARTSFAAHLRLIGPTHHEMADEVLAGEHDTILGSRAEAFRAGHSHADAGLLEALAGPMAWLDGWAQHVGNCQGGYFCTCGLTAARSELSAAIAAAKGADK